MNMNNSRDKDDIHQQAKQEGADTLFDNNKLVFPTRGFSSSSTRQWGGFKNPRIVRVSRTFGGKDRHSKVCTIRGLRDRRIRLSVPTAIQLYDLQDRLGLSQPSKVVDWLLDVTKNEIDKLPPLQIPPGNFSQFQQPPPSPPHHHLFPPQDNSLSHFFSVKDGGTGARGININEIIEETNMEADQRSENNNAMEKEQEDHLGNNDYAAGGYGGSHSSNQLLAQNFFPLANNYHQSSSLPGLLNNNNNGINALLPYNSYLHWEPSSLSLSNFGNHHHPLENSQQQQPSSGSHHHQLYFCPSIPTVQPILAPPNPFLMSSSLTENQSSSRQIINNHDHHHHHHLHLSSSSSSSPVMPNSLVMPTTLHWISSPMKPFSLNVNNPKENDDAISKGRKHQ